MAGEPRTGEIRKGAPRAPGRIEKAPAWTWEVAQPGAAARLREELEKTLSVMRLVSRRVRPVARGAGADCRC